MLSWHKHSETRSGGELFQHGKGLWWNHNGERLNISPILAWEQSKDFSEVLAGAIKQEKETKGTQNAKEVVKLCLFTDDTILHTGNSKEWALWVQG